MTDSVSPRAGRPSSRATGQERGAGAAPAVALAALVMDAASGEYVPVTARATVRRAQPFGPREGYAMIALTLADAMLALTPREHRVWWSLVARMDYECRVAEPPALTLAHLELHRQNLYATLEKLEARGFILRERDPEDGRGAVIAISLNPHYVARGSKGAKRAQRRWDALRAERAKGTKLRVVR